MQKTPVVLRSLSKYTPLGELRISILSNNILLAFHSCDRNHDLPANRMSFTRPWHDLSILFCSKCGFRFEIRGLPLEDFDKSFNEIERSLEKKIDQLWEEYIQPGPRSVEIDFKDGLITVDSGGQRGFRAWHCLNPNGQKQIMKITKAGNTAGWLKLHCPRCGYDIEFECSPHTPFEEVVINLNKTASSRWHD